MDSGGGENGWKTPYFQSSFFCMSWWSEGQLPTEPERSIDLLQRIANLTKDLGLLNQSWSRHEFPLRSPGSGRVSLCSQCNGGLCNGTRFWWRWVGLSFVSKCGLANAATLCCLWVEAAVIVAKLCLSLGRSWGPLWLSTACITMENENSAHMSLLWHSLLVYFRLCKVGFAMDACQVLLIWRNSKWWVKALIVRMPVCLSAQVCLAGTHGPQVPCLRSRCSSLVILHDSIWQQFFTVIYTTASHCRVWFQLCRWVLSPLPEVSSLLQWMWIDPGKNNTENW